jgi:peptide-methionine (S)-S-oxide reductase
MRSGRLQYGKLRRAGRVVVLGAVAALVALAAVAPLAAQGGSENTGSGSSGGNGGSAAADDAAGSSMAIQPASDEAAATFAGGCFWCVEEAFDKHDGVLRTISGYTGGELEDPSYQQVASGNTDHAEAVRIIYDPDTITYAELLEVFWQNIDPLDAGGQFCDRGSQYRSAIFYHDEEQKRLATESKQELASSDRFSKPIVTNVVELSDFYAAETYHQNYYEKNPTRYKLYKEACGRAQRLKELWG